MDVFKSYMKNAYRELKDKNVKELAERFKNTVYSFLSIISSTDVFKGWLFHQAPITITKPTTDFIAFVAQDGRIYINPVFINAISNFVNDNYGNLDDKEKNELIADAICYIITHEVMHIMLGHITKTPEIIKQTHERTDIPAEVLKHVSNVAMDYSINVNVCNNLFKKAIDLGLLNMGIINQENMIKALNNLKVFNMEKLINDVENINKNHNGLENLTWTEIFNLLVGNVDKDKAKNFLNKSNSVCVCGSGLKGNINGNQQNKKTSNKTDDSERDDKGNGNYQDSDTNNNSDDDKTDENSVGNGNGSDVSDGEEELILQTPHGEVYRLRKSDIENITDGYLDKSNNNGEEISLDDVKNLSANLHKQITKYGFGSGSLKRELQDNIDVDRRSMNNVLQNLLKEYLGFSHITSNWCKPNRRFSDLPGSKMYGLKKDFTVFFDVSGSIGDREANIITSSLSYLVTNNIVNNLRICLFDDGLINVYNIKTYHDFKKFKLMKDDSGGGTVLLKALNDPEITYKRDEVVAVFTDSMLSDDLTELSYKIKEIYNQTGNKVIWFSVYNNKKFADIAKKCGLYIKPILIDFTTKKLTFFDINKTKRMM